MAKIKARQIDTGTGPNQIVQTDVSGNTNADTLGGQPVGTTANDIVALDASSKLPAVDGSQLTNLPAGATGGLIDEQVFTSSGTWNKPAGTERIEVIAVGGGGGGGSVTGTATGTKAAGGGGSGSYSKGTVLTSANIASSYGVTIGTGGAAGAGGGNGGFGTETVFGNGTTEEVSGGGGWSGAANGANGNNTTTNFGGNVVNQIAIPGIGGNGGLSATTATNVPPRGGNGGSNTLGSGGQVSGSSSGIGKTGTGYGGGGSGGHTNTISSTLAGGPGTAGIIIVRSYSA